jgi:hypothetical protein
MCENARQVLRKAVEMGRMELKGKKVRARVVESRTAQDTKRFSGAGEGGREEKTIRDSPKRVLCRAAQVH